MNIDEQFENFLAELGVEMERPEEQTLYNSDLFSRGLHLSSLA